MDVAVVIVNWNGGSTTLECLERVSQFDVSAIVVDNGSSDGSAELVEARYPQVTLLRAGTNLGYAGGNNLGIRRALDDGARFIWVMNNDLLPERNALGELLAGMHVNAGCLATRSPTEPTAFADGRAVTCSGCEVGFHPAEGLKGASLFFRAEALERVGLFDETYFHYFEEVDLVARLREHGFAVGLACRAVAHHSAGTSLSPRSAQALYYFVRNGIRFERRRSGRSFVGALRSGRWRAYLAVGESLRHRDGRAIVATLLAVTDAAVGRYGRRDLPARYREPLPWAWGDFSAPERAPGRSRSAGDVRRQRDTRRARSTEARRGSAGD